MGHSGPGHPDLKAGGSTVREGKISEMNRSTQSEEDTGLSSKWAFN